MIQNINTIKTSFFSLLFSIGVTFSVHAQVKFYDGTYEDLQNKAKKEQKVYFIDFYTSWCGFCKKLDATTFRSEEFGKYVDKHFLAFKMNAENGHGKKLAIQYAIKGYPTTLVFDAKGKLLGKISGYRDVNGFVAELRPYESKTTIKHDNSDALTAYLTILNQEYSSLKKKTFNSAVDQFSQLKEQCISLGANNKRFEFEELQLDTKLGYGSEKASELDLYYYIGKRDTDKIKTFIQQQRQKNYITKDNFSFFILHFLTQLKPDVDVLKWINELHLELKNKTTLELKAYTQYAIGDLDDARETVTKLRKQFYKKQSNERVELLEKITAK